MSKESNDQPTLAGIEDAELAHYRAISPLAVGALLLGLISIIVLWQPLLLVLPLATVAAALLALRQISRSEGALVGRTPAIIGLALALLFGSMTIANTVVRERVLIRQAQEFAEDWLKLVQNGELQRAHQLHLEPPLRQLPGVSLARFYAANQQAQDAFDHFYGASPLKELAGVDDRNIHLQKAETSRDNSAEYVILHYRAESTDAAADTIDFVIVLERTLRDNGGAWRVIRVNSPLPESN